MRKLRIIGMGAEGPAGLASRALELIQSADTIVGTRRLLEFFSTCPATRLELKSDLGETAAMIAGAMAEGETVLLASGDPGFYGIGNQMVSRLGSDAVEIIPAVSSMQLAFARINESWDDAALTSVHGRPLGEIAALVRANRKIGVLTDPQNSPAAIGRELVRSGLTGYRAFVCENLGSLNERVLETDVEGLATLDTSPLSTLVLIREERVLESTPVRRRLFGIPDDQFVSRKPLKGLITKAEIRVMSLSRLSLRADSVVWDIGAGSGSVTVEAALIAYLGRVYAVERQAGDAAIVRENLEKFGIVNAELVAGQAPEVLSSLPDPDAIFIGGSGGCMDGILDAIHRRLKPGGSVVLNIATISNLDSAVGGLVSRGFEVDVTMVNIARSRPVAGLLRFEALDPVFVVSGVRRETN